MDGNTMASEHSQPRRSPLDELPGELRNAIFEESFRNITFDCDETTHEAPGILTASKRAYQETRHLSNEYSEFRATNQDKLVARLESMSPTEIKHIKYITVDNSAHEVDDVAISSREARKAAFEAQMILFEVVATLPEVQEVQEAEIRIKLKLAGEVILTATPWKTYTQLLKEADAHKLAEAKVSTEIRDALKFEANMGRVFDYDHEYPDECWSIEWGYLADYSCSCLENDDDGGEDDA